MIVTFWKDLISALVWLITQRRMVILYLRFGTTYRSNLQGSRSPETSVKDYHLTLRNNPEQHTCRQHRGGNLKSWKDLFRCWFHPIMKAVILNNVSSASVAFYIVDLLLPHQARQLHRTEYLQPARHPATTAVLRTAIKETRCIATRQECYLWKSRTNTHQKVTL
jgi:hypothetical protein